MSIKPLLLLNVFGALLVTLQYHLAQANIIIQDHESLVAIQDEYTLEMNETLTIPAPGVLENDLGIHDEMQGAFLIATPDYGTLALEPDGAFTYTPPLDFTGTEISAYLITDGITASLPANILFHIRPPNLPPTGINLSNNNVPENEPAGTLVGVFSTIDENQGDTHTYSLVSGPGSADNQYFTISEDNLLTNQIFDYEAKNSYAIRVQTTDRGGLSYEKQFIISVSDVNEPPQALDGYFEVMHGESLTVPAPGVLSNDNDVDGDDLVAELKDSPLHAEHFTLEADGSFTYEPQNGFIGEDRFTYQAFDGGLYSDVALVVINVYDATSPHVEWVVPVGNGDQLDVAGEVIILEVNATDDVEVKLVRFYRWDAEIEQMVDIAQVTDPPYHTEIDTRQLNPHWNQIFARAYDSSGNESGRPWVWLYRLETSHRSFLPIVRR